MRSIGLWFIRIVFVVTFVALDVAAGLHYRDVLRRYAPAAQFLSQYTVEKRRPEVVEMVRKAPAPDLAYGAVADAALQDALGTVDLTNVDAATRLAWIDSVRHYDAELRDAQRLLLDAIRQRPGWTFHDSELGKIEFARAQRSERSSVDVNRWLTPVEAAIHGSPGESSSPLFAAAAALSLGSIADPALEQRVLSILPLAFRDPSFVQTTEPYFVALLGWNAVVQRLPPTAAVIKAALDAETPGGNADRVHQLFSMWERLEWRQRQLDLDAIEQRSSLGDIAGVKTACSEWVQHHSIYDFDTPAGRKQVAAILDLWPAEPGEWRADQRTDLVLFFLQGRTGDVDGRAVARAASLLSGIPEPIAARAALLSGDVGSAESLAENSATGGALEWTSFYVDLARYYLARRDNERAATALAQIAPAAQPECDVLLAQRAVAEATAKASSADEAAGTREYSSAYWSGATLPLCVDSSRLTQLSATIDVQKASVVSFGFDQGRVGTQFVPAGRVVLNAPIDGSVGRHIFSCHVVAGGQIEPVTAVVR